MLKYSILLLVVVIVMVVDGIEKIHSLQIQVQVLVQIQILARS
jgi:hypothetical protein